MLRRALRNLVNLDEPPERTARAFAIGAFIGFTPLLGLHTILAALVAVGLRLNKTAVLAGSLLNNPWTIAPIIGASWAIGSLLVGSPEVALPQVGLTALVSAEFWRALAAQWRQLLPFAVGGTILSFVAAAVSYPLMLSILRAYRRKYRHRS
ncbi:MAG: DUF2062 domain-containing protein [Blastocatellia bacterium]|nr:DUF2062 domain-containing protein [Blastocatellia bacterium]